MQKIINSDVEICQTCRILRIKLIKGWGPTYQLAPKVLTFSRSKNGEYLACCSQVDENYKRTTTKKKLNNKKFEFLLAELKKIKIPAVPEFEDICDGGFTELEIENYGGKAHYQWWTGTPLGWGELDQLVELFIELSGLVKQSNR